ncbi:MAG: class I SAM-dependent methyltransferase [Alphaproteobacteria bacterium]
MSENKLLAHLRATIRADGPISVAHYMGEALLHPRWGYYPRRDPLGRDGDFITAPEISQCFGELIGAWCAVAWELMGAPTPVDLVELGPGRGTLMADALRAIGKAKPALIKAMRIRMVEASPALRVIQERTLSGLPATWHDDVSSLPPGKLLLIANEFFDALPIRQIARGPQFWHERMVALDEAGGLCFAVSPAPTPLGNAIDASLANAPPGSIVEIAPAAIAIVRALASRLAEDGGVALIVDYGHAEPAAGDTLQAVRAHKYADPLAAPGEADLTAHVDFAALARTARDAGCTVHGPATQGAFLTALGIEARVDILARNARSPEQAERVRSGARRLIDAAEMGTLFKAMAVAHPSIPPLPGFEPAD